MDSQAVADRGKPPRGKDVLASAKCEEQSRLRRQVRQLQLERDILRKATAWLDGMANKSSTGLRAHARQLHLRSEPPPRLRPHEETQLQPAQDTGSA